ncbi:MAG: hypothetical protein ACK56F_03895, partial [bacterium]
MRYRIGKSATASRRTMRRNPPVCRKSIGSEIACRSRINALTAPSRQSSCFMPIAPTKGGWTSGA